MNAFRQLLCAISGFGLLAFAGGALAQETPAAAPAGVKLVEAKAK